jgi:hypothetical protein
MKREVNMRTPTEDQKGKGTQSIKKKTPVVDPKADLDSRIITDPLGSWTGVPEDNFFDKPIQDADDL